MRPKKLCLALGLCSASLLLSSCIVPVRERGYAPGYYAPAPVVVAPAPVYYRPAYPWARRW